MVGASPVSMVNAALVDLELGNRNAEQPLEILASCLTASTRSSSLFTPACTSRSSRRA